MILKIWNFYNQSPHASFRNLTVKESRRVPAMSKTIIAESNSQGNWNCSGNAHCNYGGQWQSS